MYNKLWQIIKNNIDLLVVIALTIITLWLAWIFHIKGHEFLYTVMISISTGLSTGCAIEIIDSIKNIKKSNYAKIIDALEYVNEKIKELMNDKEYMDNLNDESNLYEKVYSKLAKITDINGCILKYKNEFFKEGKLKEYFKKELDYNVDYESIATDKLHDELLSNKYDDISKLYKIAALNELKYAFLYSKIMDKIIEAEKKVFDLERKIL